MPYTAWQAAFFIVIVRECPFDDFVDSLPWGDLAHDGKSSRARFYCHLMSFSSFSDLVHARRSVRIFEDRPVSRKLVSEILELAQWAPYSCNLQLAQCTVVDDPVLLKRLSTQVDAKFGWAPCIIVLSYDQRLGRKRFASEISVGGIMQTILLAATERGLWSCPMAGFRGDHEIKNSLNIPKQHSLALLIAIGYQARDLVQEKKDRFRLPIEQFAFWNKDEQRRIVMPKLSMRIKDWSMKDIILYRERLAPVYLYHDHYRLHVFSDAVFEAVISKYLSLSENTRKNVLDLCSYDGMALRCLLNKRAEDSYQFADHLPYIGTVLEQLEARPRFVSMSASHVLDAPDKEFDAVTCIHKIEFTPEWERLIQEAFRVLKPGGCLFVSTMQPSFLKRCFDVIRSYFHAYQYRPNVYDGNPFYKIGPFASRDLKYLMRVGEISGFNIVSHGVDRVSSGALVKHDYGWVLFQKRV